MRRQFKGSTKAIELPGVGPLTQEVLNGFQLNCVCDLRKRVDDDQSATVEYFSNRLSNLLQEGAISHQLRGRCEIYLYRIISATSQEGNQEDPYSCPICFNFNFFPSRLPDGKLLCIECIERVNFNPFTREAFPCDFAPQVDEVRRLEAYTRAEFNVPHLQGQKWT